jgi:hypothetical protein
MILEDLLGTSVMDPDAAAIAFDDLNGAAKTKSSYAALQKMREEGGGLKLAYKLSTIALLKHCIIIAEVTRPCWDWYTLCTTTCKTPKDAVIYAIKMVSDWRCDDHLLATLRHSLYCESTRQKCDIVIGLVASEKKRCNTNAGPCLEPPFRKGVVTCSATHTPPRLLRRTSRRCLPRQARFSCRVTHACKECLLA